MDAFLNGVNTFAWVASNVLIAYAFVALVVFVLMYYILFDPSATTAGKILFRFMVSLVGALAMIFIGTFIDLIGDAEWTLLPPEVDSWRPLIRFFVYGYVAFTITSLAILLAKRKWYPEKIKSAPDLDMVKVRHTQEIPIIKPIED